MVRYLLPIEELERVVMDHVLQREEHTKHPILILDITDDKFRGDAFYCNPLPNKEEEGYHRLTIFIKDDKQEEKEKAE